MVLSSAYSAWPGDSPGWVGGISPGRILAGWELYARDTCLTALPYTNHVLLSAWLVPMSSDLYRYTETWHSHAKG